MSNPLIQARPRAHGSVLAAFLLTTTLPLACGSNAAAAADMPMKAPAPLPYQWTGCYLGLNAGGGASGTDFTSSISGGTHLGAADAALVGTDGTGSANVSAFVGGAQAGCNLQTGTFVFGLEGDYDYFRSNPQFGNNTNTLSDGVTPFTLSQSLTTDFLATVRPRIGIAADRNFAYVTGGAAFTKASYTESYVDAAVPAGTGIATGSKFLVGWTAGVGWEYAATDHWTFRLEYLFAKFGTTAGSGVIADGGGGTNALQGSADLVVQTLRAGVNFKF